MKRRSCPPPMLASHARCASHARGKQAARGGRSCRCALLRRARLNRTESARVFYRLLVLHSNRLLRVAQDAPYGEVRITLWPEAGEGGGVPSARGSRRRFVWRGEWSRAGCAIEHERQFHAS